MTKNDDLAAVVQLACLTEDRSDDEQRALLNVAARVDREHNRRTVTNRLWGPDGPTGPLSDLVALAMSTRVLDPEGGQREVGPPKGHRFAADCLDDLERERAECPECGGPFTRQEWADRHFCGLDEIHDRCCKECRRGEG